MEFILCELFVHLFSDIKIEDIDTEEKATKESENQDIFGSQDYSQEVWDNSVDSSDEVKPNKKKKIDTVDYLNSTFYHSNLFF